VCVRGGGPPKLHKNFWGEGGGGARKPCVCKKKGWVRGKKWEGGNSRTIWLLQQHGQEYFDVNPRRMDFILTCIAI